MTAPDSRILNVSALLSFNGGFVDTAGFLGLQGLFTAHVTGNFVTLAATLVSGTHGAVAKLLALPEFVIVVALARLAGAALAARELPRLRILLGVKALCLVGFFALAVSLGPFPNSDAPAALLTGFMGIAGMAIQNAVQRVHYSNIPPSTLMTGNTTQAVMDAIDLLSGAEPAAGPIHARFARTIRSILWFAVGCGVAAVLYYAAGFWCLIVPAIVGTTTAILHRDT
jgi:uncharacterized membrane protein YoaK (UPF0700 family)